jgi:hypothetical protein
MDPREKPPILEYRCGQLGDGTISPALFQLGRAYDRATVIGVGLLMFLVMTYVLRGVLFMWAGWARMAEDGKEPSWVLKFAAVLAGLIVWRLWRARRVKVIRRDEHGETTVMVIKVNDMRQIQAANALIQTYFAACLLAGAAPPLLLAERRRKGTAVFDGNAQGVKALILEMPRGAPFVPAMTAPRSSFFKRLFHGVWRW